MNDLKLIGKLDILVIRRVRFMRLLKRMKIIRLGMLIFLGRLVGENVAAR